MAAMDNEMAAIGGGECVGGGETYRLQRSIGELLSDCLNRKGYSFSTSCNSIVSKIKTELGDYGNYDEHTIYCEIFRAVKKTGGLIDSDWPKFLAKSIRSKDPGYWDSPQHEVFRKIVLISIVSAVDGISGELNGRSLERCVMEIVKLLRPIADRILEYKRQKGAIQELPVSLRYLESTLVGKEGNRLSYKGHNQLTKIIKKINRCGILRCAKPVAPKKPPNSSVLPENIRLFQNMDKVDEYLAYIWDGGIRHIADKDDRYHLIWYYSLIESLYNDETSFSIMVRMKSTGLMEEELVTPVHLLENQDYYHHTILPLKPRFIMYSYYEYQRLRNEKSIKSKGKWAIVLNTQNHPVPSLIDGDPNAQKYYQERSKELEKKLKNNHRFLVRKMFEDSGQANDIPSELLSLVRFSDMVRSRLIFDPGIEPFFFNILGKPPFPADDRLGGFHRVLSIPEKYQSLGFISDPYRSQGKQEDVDQKTYIVLGNEKRSFEKVDEDLYIDHRWAANARDHLKKVRKEISARFGNSEYCSASKKELFHRYIENEIQRALESGARASSAHVLGLRWICYEFTTRNFTAGTAKEYMNNFLRDLLFSPPFESAVDMQYWDDSDISELEQRIENVKSKNKRISNMRSFLGFCQLHEMLRNASMDFTSVGYTSFVRRNRIIGLHEFDRLIESIEGEKRHVLLVRCILIMAFYGGLRASEILELSLNDVYIYENECYIDIRKGKSFSAAREIPLHYFAPQHLVNYIKEYQSVRLSELKKMGEKNLNKVAFMGPQGEPDVYTRDAVLTPIIRFLQDFMGERMDLHTLRHGFVSWLMLRWYAGRYPDFEDMLLEQGHVNFDAENKQRFFRFFNVYDGESLPTEDETIMYHLMKVAGHADTSSIKNHYLHAFGAIHVHLMYRISKLGESKKLPGKFIAAVVPKMKHGDSRKKVEDRTIGGLARYLGIRTIEEILEIG